MNLTKLSTAALGSVAALLITTTSAFAATPFTLFGGATSLTNGATLVSDLSNTSTTDDFSGIGLTIPSNMTFADITGLSTTYNVGDDDCMGGSPRFQIHLATSTGTKTVHVYLGPTPNFTGCATGDLTTGNLIGSTDARFDLTQLGGPFYGTYTDALAYAAGLTVQGVQLVADAGWAFTDMEQSIDVTNPVITFATTSATSKEQCKVNGWMSFSSPTFKNQGECVSYFAKRGMR
jgi:hypothetical protein